MPYRGKEVSAHGHPRLPAGSPRHPLGSPADRRFTGHPGARPPAGSARRRQDHRSGQPGGPPGSQRGGSTSEYSHPHLQPGVGQGHGCPVPGPVWGTDLPDAPVFHHPQLLLHCPQTICVPAGPAYAQPAGIRARRQGPGPAGDRLRRHRGVRRRRAGGGGPTAHRPTHQHHGQAPGGGR